MTKTTPGMAKHLRWLLELLLSAYLTGPSLTVYLFKVNGSFLLLLANRIARAHYPPSANPTDIDYEFQLAFDLLWCIAAAATFILLRLLARFSLTGIALRRFAGLAAVAWFPLYWLCFPRMVTGLPYLSNVTILLFGVEVLAIVVCAHFYPRPKWPFSQRVSLLLLVLHFGLWLCPFLPERWGFDLFSIGWYHVWIRWRELGLLYLLLGFCSTLSWALYLKPQPETRQPREPAVAR